jgi:hypothetical protein
MRPDMSKELDGNYAAFGKLVKGEELLDQILKTEVRPRPTPACRRQSPRTAQATAAQAQATVACVLWTSRLSNQCTRLLHTGYLHRSPASSGPVACSLLDPLHRGPPPAAAAAPPSSRRAERHHRRRQRRRHRRHHRHHHRRHRRQLFLHGVNAELEHGIHSAAGGAQAHWLSAQAQPPQAARALESVLHPFRALPLRACTCSILQHGALTCADRHVTLVLSVLRVTGGQIRRARVLPVS